ncbi:MAG TPA: mechanosensitive ion channel family protein [Prolixibacteraceae bacterium]|nr:mechanosensitive ion channel family protein [Prolixibacteraceae bacterium]
MEKFFTGDYWSLFLEKIFGWIIHVLPGIFLLIIFLVVALSLLRYFLKRLTLLLIGRAQKHEGIEAREAEKRLKTLIGIIWGIGKVIIWTIVIILLLNKLGIDIRPILAGAGIVGLAVGFGAQELVRDFITGFFIILENQVRMGDVAIINGTGGTVEKIELRTITLRDFSGVVHIFQNGKINTISNMTKEWSAMVLDMAVAYKEDPEKVIQIMVKVGLEMQNDEVFGPKILEPIEVVGVDAFADSAVIIRARFKTKPIEQWSVGREYRKRLKKAFDQQGIEIPFPHTTIYWGDRIKPLKMEVTNESLLKK